MGKHLEFDEKVKKEFGITKDLDLDDVFKHGFIRSQFNEIQKAAYRVRVDLMIATHQVNMADDENIKAQHQSKVTEHRMLLKQFARSLEFLKELGDELGIDLSE